MVCAIEYTFCYSIAVFVVPFRYSVRGCGRQQPQQANLEVNACASGVLRFTFCMRPKAARKPNPEDLVERVVRLGIVPRVLIAPLRPFRV